MTKIKLCGMMTLSDIAAANKLKPDYVGFVFYPKSRRCISSETASLLIRHLAADIKAVGVYVNEAASVIADMYRSGLVHLAQLHGDEDNAYIETLRGLCDIPLVKAFRVKNKADLDAAYKSDADYILLDAGAGDGRTFDWRLLSGFDRPYFLAGGLTPQNVTEAVRRLRPFGADVSSGIETDGRKDEIKMTDFVNAVRSAYD